MKRHTLRFSRRSAAWRWVFAATIVVLIGSWSSLHAQDSTKADTTAAEPEPTDLDRAYGMLVSIRGSLDTLLSLEKRVRSATPKDQELLLVHGRRFARKIKDLQVDLLDLITRLYIAGEPVDSLKREDVDDIIEAGSVLGTVKAMGLANTTVVTFDNRRMLIPNRKIWGDTIENRSAEPLRRLDLVVRIGYQEDLERCLAILNELAREDPRVLAMPEPDVFVLGLEDSWIDIAVRPWIRNKDWWPLLTDMPRQVRLRFAEKGIDIPIPRLHVSQAAGGSSVNSSHDK